MAYIAREDGEHLVIPSYRDVLTAKNKSALKNEILTLSQNYGNYITMQRKGALQYELAFSTETGYLLGESVWHFFKRPIDMIYCEEVPNTTEVILVIVKDGSVYLDGSFPREGIPEELVIFLTQQNNFEISVYGDVPISQTPEEGKFSFDAGSVKSFTVLDAPLISRLPLLKQYQLKPVDTVLKSLGISGLSLKPILFIIVLAGLGWMIWSYISEQKQEAQQQQQVNPYQAFYDNLTSPAPDAVMQAYINSMKMLLAIPGWQVIKLDGSPSSVTATVQSQGSKLENLFAWAEKNNVSVNFNSSGVTVSTDLKVDSRPSPQNIYPIKNVAARLIDRMADVYPGNHVNFGDVTSQQVFSNATINIDYADLSPAVLALIGEQFKDLPLVFDSISTDIDNTGRLSGSIALRAFGS